MGKQRSSARWIILAAVSAALIILGIFFTLQDLGTAAKYAGIGSFFVGAIGSVMTATSLAVALRSSRQDAGRTGPSAPATEDATEPPPTPNQPRPDVTVNNSTGVLVGDHGEMLIEINHDQPQPGPPKKLSDRSGPKA